MSKRGKRKPQKRRTGNNLPISQKSYEHLTKELRNARNRIRRLMNSQGSDYQGPALSDFYIKNVLDRLTTGTHINTIYAMTRNATAAKISKLNVSRETNPIVAQMYGGLPVRQKQYSRLMKAVTKANANIDKSKQKYGYIPGVTPDYITPDGILNQVINEKGLDYYINSIDKNYTLKNLKPTAINAEGEAGTIAEVNFLNDIINRENKRRIAGQEQVKDQLKTRGFFMTQQEFDVTPINTSTWDTMEKKRRRTAYFTDAHDMKRAVNWMNNYINTVDALESYIRANRGITDDNVIIEELETIYRILSKIDNPDLVRKLVRYSEYITIQANYFGDASDLEGILDNITWAFLSFEKEYLA